MGYSPARIQEHDKIQIARMVSMGMAPLGMSPMVGIVAKKVFDKVAPDAIKSVVPNLVPPMNRMPGGGMPIRMLR
jgi:hypothetical protein